MKKKIVVYTFLIALLAMSIVFASAIFLLYSGSETDIKESLIEQTNVYAGLIDGGGLDALKELDGKTYGSTRLTIIDGDGEVVLDTLSNVSESHADREEVVAANSGEPKVVRRYSETLGKEMYYYAIKTDGGLVVRLAVDVSDVGSYLRGGIPMFILAIIAAAGVSLLFAERLSVNVTDKVDAVRKSLASLNRGEYVAIETSEREPEYYALLAEINALSASIGRHIASEHAERDKLNCILDNISQGIIALDKNGRPLQVNRAAADLVAAEDNFNFRAFTGDAQGAENGFLTEHKDRKLFVNCVVPESSVDISKIVIVTDVTEQQNMIKQKSDFFANASHELKTPLTTMKGMAELLMARDCDDATHRYAERIYREASRMNSLIMDMLRLSNLERLVEDEATVAEVRLKDIAEEIVAEYAPLAAKKALKTQINGDVSLFADSKKMFELLENLYTNAVNYNVDSGRVAVELLLKDGRPTVRVCDTGIGIEKEHIPRLCERFYRVDKSRSKKTGGTGLGLAIVKHICAIYNAELKIDSEVGVGTAVEVCFPKSEQSIKN